MGTKQQDWAVGLAAISVHVHEGDSRKLGGWSRLWGRSKRRDTCREWLQILWNIHAAKDITAVLTMLRDTGESQTWERMASADEGGAIDEHPDFERRMAIIEQQRGRVAGRRLLAWDAGRLATVAGWAYLADYLTEDEAWAWILPMGARVRAAYGSWEEFSQHYLIGRAFWSSADSTAIAGAIQWLLENRKSAWKVAGWLPPDIGVRAFPLETTAAPRRDGAATSAAGDTAEVDPATPLRPLLDQLEAAQRVLCGRAPAYRAGAREDDLQRLSTQFSGTPSEVLDLLRWHDGQEPSDLEESARGALLHPAMALRLLGAREILAMDPARCLIGGARHLPLLGGSTAQFLLSLALSGPETASVWAVNLEEPDAPRKLAGTLQAFVVTCLELRRGARLDRAALHPGEVEVTPSQGFKLALSGILTEENGGSHTVLSTLHPIVGAREYLAMLAFWWSIFTRADLLSTIEPLLAAPAPGAPRSRAAYDAGRAVFLARAGVCTAMLEPAEAWAFISRAAPLVRASVSSWGAYASAYLEGLGLNFPIPDRSPEALAALPGAPAWSSADAVQSASVKAARALLAPGGRWTSIPWETPLLDDEPPPMPRPRVTSVPPSTSDQSNLARAVRRARPGDVFEIQEGVYGPIAPLVSIAVVARWGTNPQRVHLVGHEGRPAVTMGDAGLLLSRLMISAPTESGIVFDQGGLILDRCLFNTPSGVPLVLTTANAHAHLKECHLGGLGVLLLDGTVGIERSTFGQASGAPCITVERGALHLQDTTLDLAGSGSVCARGEGSSLQVSRCSFNGVLADCIEVSDGAALQIEHTSFQGGRLGIHARGATVTGTALSFGASRDGARRQLRGALRLTDGARATLSEVLIEGESSVVAGTTPEGHLEPRAGRVDPPRDPFPKAAVLVSATSVLTTRDLEIFEEDAPALVLLGNSEAVLSGGQLRGTGQALEIDESSRCALHGVAVKGEHPFRSPGERCAIHVEPLREGGG